ncbi:PQQ-dependent sugar dehydrogenase [Delftia sp. RIT313]|uniref:PQQ-dependent sugar dehydrogenase n=1 Tax=Delftia sp. RIT313 TaxID=1468410 RepID=UPI002285858A
MHDVCQIKAARLHCSAVGRAACASCTVTGASRRHWLACPLWTGKVTAREQVLTRLGQRVRDVRQGQDGWLYLLTDAQDGQLLRVTATP